MKTWNEIKTFGMSIELGMGIWVQSEFKQAKMISS